MRLSSTFVFLGLVVAGALAYPTYDESNSLYARSSEAEDLALRDLYEAYFDEISARDYDDAMDLEARHEHLHFGNGDGPSVTVHLRSDDFDELDARDYDDAADLEARHEHLHFGSGEGPSVTVHLRSDEFDELDARDYDDVSELEARHHGEGPRVTIHFREAMDDLAARYDELLEEREFDDEEFEARDYEELDAREPLHPRIGTVILSRQLM